MKTVSERKGKEHSQLESENQKGKPQEEMSLNSKEQMVTSLKTKTQSFWKTPFLFLFALYSLTVLLCPIVKGSLDEKLPSYEVLKMLRE